MIKKARMINDNPITIYFGARNINDIFVVELIKEFTNINIKIFLSGGESLQNLPKPVYENIDYEISSGRIGSQIIDDFSSLSPPKTNFYLCGNPTMVNEIGLLLKQNNFENIFEERFIPSTQ
jgi:NAD(P)H-flavin reductase